jgi:hypothetical protein
MTKTLDYEKTKKALIELFGEFSADNILCHIEGTIDMRIPSTANKRRFDHFMQMVKNDYTKEKFKI